MRSLRIKRLPPGFGAKVNRHVNRIGRKVKNHVGIRGERSHFPGGIRAGSADVIIRGPGSHDMQPLASNTHNRNRYSRCPPHRISCVNQCVPQNIRITPPRRPVPENALRGIHIVFPGFFGKVHPINHLHAIETLSGKLAARKTSVIGPR
ncbi:MAG: hypothetical protein BWY42_01543 [Candidatus Omnitrophica bacterium ADurb.Bin277]|nr:MAG: hypothetical protein BWY42_01543 [Candidatus Omnitrophica bacterium ADurb.Bin277]